MSEVHRYKVVKMLSQVGNRISYDPHGPEVVMASAYDQLKAENAALRDKYEILLEAASNMLSFCKPTCMNDEKWRDRVADMAREASHG